MPYPAFIMRSLLLPAIVAAVAAVPVHAQAPAPSQPAPPKAYKVVAVVLPQPFADPSLAAFRKDLADIANKKDRAALAKITANDFIWMGEKGDKADKKKSGIDNLAAALELDAKEGLGWEALKSAANEATAEPWPDHKGVVCSPAYPKYDEAAADAVAKDTGTDPAEWAYVSKPDAVVRDAAKADAPVIDKLGLQLVRIMVEQQAAPAAGAPQIQPFLKVVTPSGKVGYVALESISVLGTDQLCYVKDGSSWKIAGYAGSD